MTIGDVLARVRAVLEAAPFELTESPDPFDFDHQPPATVDAVYRLAPSLTGREGYLGAQALESWSLAVYLARQAGADVNAVCEQLRTDISSLTVALPHDATASGDYACSDEDVESDLVTPGEEEHFVIAHLTVGLEFDRAV